MFNQTKSYKLQQIESTENLFFRDLTQLVKLIDETKDEDAKFELIRLLGKMIDHYDQKEIKTLVKTV